MPADDARRVRDQPARTRPASGLPDEFVPAKAGVRALHIAGTRDLYPAAPA
jgi:hypothetical protein